MRTAKKLISIILIVLGIICLFICTVIKSLLEWYRETFGVSFKEIIYTIKSPMKGADISFLLGAVKRAMPSLIIFVMVILVSCYIYRIFRTTSASLVIFQKLRIRFNTIVFTSLFIICAVGSCIVLSEINKTLRISEYFQLLKTETHIYEDYYVKPDVDSITAFDKPKNLIYIYLESMETTYASADEGGYQPEINYIPHLTQMAKDNISFSDNDKLGGFTSTSNTGWTIVAIFATQTGLPFNYPIGGNEDFGNRKSFAKGVISLGDILHEKGYYQEFLCGSDSDFAGRRTFFEQHGNFDIYDRVNAKEDGYITEDYVSPWGVPDKDLYTIAKDELTRMSQMDQPFNLTMLTVDTHHVDGWMCPECENKYSEQLPNVVECADRQIDKFIKWCSEQSWYEDTLIVIIGDHPRMDKSLVEGREYNDRKVYNCFINAPYEKEGLSLNYRMFAPEDMFPSVISALGYSIPGNRLGLGTDMFSGRSTLVEEMGLDRFNYETDAYSSYFIDKFS